MNQYEQGLSQSVADNQKGLSGDDPGACQITAIDISCLDPDYIKPGRTVPKGVRPALLSIFINFLKISMAQSSTLETV